MIATLRLYRISVLPFLYPIARCMTAVHLHFTSCWARQVKPVLSPRARICAYPGCPVRFLSLVGPGPDYTCRFRFILRSATSVETVVIVSGTLGQCSIGTEHLTLGEASPWSVIVFLLYNPFSHIFLELCIPSARLLQFSTTLIIARNP
jgi:hypothetical protein